MILAKISPASLLQLQSIHKAKTGALIKASVQMGALCSSELVNSDALAALGIYGEKIGLAFQVIDDILDIEVRHRNAWEKPVGSDEGLNKLTYPPRSLALKPQSNTRKTCMMKP